MEDEWPAWCFDNAVHLWGSRLEQAMEDAAEKCKTKKDGMRKAERVLHKWLGIPLKFREPVAMPQKKFDDVQKQFTLKGGGEF